jgi:hypothetical protein
MRKQESIGLVTRKMKKNHFFGLFMKKYHDLSDNFFRPSSAVAIAAR